MILTLLDTLSAYPLPAHVAPVDRANSVVWADSAASNQDDHRIFHAEDSGVSHASLEAVFSYRDYQAATVPFLSLAGPDYGPYTVEAESAQLEVHILCYPYH